MSDIPRELVAVVLKTGDTICVHCVNQTPEVLDDDANTVVLSTDDWKGEVLVPDSLCDRCEHEFVED